MHNSPRTWLGLLVLSLAVRLLVAWPLRQPGYADAYYYAVGARQLHAGQGFNEPFIWNYLDPPPNVPHRGYLYWMPLAAVLGWLGMVALGDSFWAIQAPFVLLSALLPLVAYGVAWDLTGKPRHAMLQSMYGTPARHDHDWKDAMHYLSASAGPGDVVAFRGGQGWHAYWYYYDGPPINKVDLLPEEGIGDLSAQATGSRRAWLVTWDIAKSCKPPAEFMSGADDPLEIADTECFPEIVITSHIWRRQEP